MYVLSSDFSSAVQAVHANSLSAPDSDFLVSICTYANLPEKLRSLVSHIKVVEKELTYHKTRIIAYKLGFIRMNFYVSTCSTNERSTYVNVLATVLK